jgi:cell division protein FtsQ
LGKKPIRKNFYKNSAHKRIARIKQSLLFAAKATFAILIMMGMSLFFILGHDYVTQCDYFKAKQFTVSGFQRLTEQLVLKQAGLGPGINTLAVNLSLARKKLLAHPWIEEAEVTRNLPGRIEIRVTEHRPLAILDLQRKFILNTKGRIFKEWSPADPVSLPIISGLEFSDLNIDPSSKATPLQAAITILNMGGSQGSILPNRAINRIHVDREIGLTLYVFDESKAIKLGYNNYPNKLKSLQNIFYHLKKRHEFVDFESIDLNNLNRIVVNPVRSGSLDSDHKEV